MKNNYHLISFIIFNINNNKLIKRIKNKFNINETIFSFSKYKLSKSL